MDKYLKFTIIIIVVIVIQVISRLYSRKKKKRIEKIEQLDMIKQPKFYLSVGVSGAILFTVMAILSFMSGEWSLSILFLLINLFYVWIILLQLNWEIKINEDNFTYRNIFGIKKTYLFIDVVMKKCSRSTRFYYNNK